MTSERMWNVNEGSQMGGKAEEAYSSVDLICCMQIQSQLVRINAQV